MTKLFSKDNRLTFVATRDLHPKLAMALAKMTKEQIKEKLVGCQALAQSTTPNGKTVVCYPQPIGKVLYEYEEKIPQDAKTWWAILKEASGIPQAKKKKPIGYFGKTQEELVDLVIEEIKRDIESGDLTALAELLTFCPTVNLIGYLPEGG